MKNKVNSIVNIIGLSIAIACCIVLTIFINYESSFDNFHPHSEETYRVVQHNNFPDQIVYWNTTAYPLAEAIRNDFDEMQFVTQTVGPISHIFSVKDNLNEVSRFEENKVLFVDSFYNNVFDLEWIIGNPERALEHHNSVVLTESLVIKYFGENILNLKSVLGKIILLNDKNPLRVTGVVKDPLGNTSQNYNMLIPYELFRQQNKWFSEDWSGNHQGTTYVVLQEEASKKDVESKIASWKKKYLKPEDEKRIEYVLQPISEIHTETLYGTSPGGGYIMPKKVINLVSFLALFILIIAVINFVNLITAQSTTKSKEIGIRKIIGSSRFQLIKQFAFENTLTVIITLIISISLVYILINKLNNAFTNINLQLTFNWSDMNVIFLIGGLIIFIASAYPAIVLSSLKPIEGLRPKAELENMRGITLRKSLLLFQFTIVQFLVIAAVIVALQMNYFRNEEFGFSFNNVIVTPGPDYNKLEVFKNSLLQNKNITNVAFGSGPPMGIHNLSLGTTFGNPQQTKAERKDAEFKAGDLNYIDFYDLELIAGNNFTSVKPMFNQFIVNETLIKSMGWTSDEAIGKKLMINEGEATIVGVVKDYHNNSLQYEITPCIILNWAYFCNQAFIKVEKTNDNILASIEKTWKETFNTSVYSFNFLDDSIENEYATENFTFKGFTILSLLAIIIACLGLYSLMTFITLRKTKEVGIRKVLGATVPQITWLFLNKFILLVGLSFIIAAPVVHYFIERWLQSFTYHINLSIWMLLSGGVLTLVIAMVTSSLHSIKAAIANPIKSLKTE